MSFLTPFMLWGALAAAIPVAIHLFFRSRYRTVPWAAMKFLLTAVEQTSRRLRFQELLLLALRMALLILLALAFARPISSIVRGGGRGDSVDAVFVFDASYSMAALDGAKSRLDRAREEANKIIDELPAQSTVQIITSAGNRQTLLGPRSPANLDQARSLLQDLEITDLVTDLAPGVSEAQRVLKAGQGANKELYIFSDMQKNGWDEQAGELKQALREMKEKTVIELVRCGTRPVKNVAIVGITSPQAKFPRPGERVNYAVLVRNTGSDDVSDLEVTLAVDGVEKNLEPKAIPKLLPHETRAVTLAAKFDKPGLRVLTARVKHDDLAPDNRFDQVVLVREQVNILVVDGNYKEREPDKSSSFFLMNALLPTMTDADRAGFYLQPRVVPAGRVSPADLARQDICILVNVALQPTKTGPAADVLPADFVAALDPFVRHGHGLMIFAGDNVQPEAYNKLLGQKYGLLPMPIRSVVRAPDKELWFINRASFGAGPAAYWTFKNDKLYAGFDGVAVWQYVDVDENLHTDLDNVRFSYYQQAWPDLPEFSKFKADAEGPLPKGLFDLSPRTRNKDFGFAFEGTLLVPKTGSYTFYLDSADGARLSVGGATVLTYDGQHAIGEEKKETVELTEGKLPIKLEYFQHLSSPGLSVAWSGPGFKKRALSVGKEENPMGVVVRLNNDKPLVTTKKVDAGEVVFIGTAADSPMAYDKTLRRTWSIWPSAGGMYIPFIHVTVNYLLRGQMQTYNLEAGQILNWHPTDKLDNIYNLVHPGGKVERLAPPEKSDKRVVVKATDLLRAGVYRLMAVPRGSESSDTAEAPGDAKSGTPIAVTADLKESADLQTLADEGLDTFLGFSPLHRVAGDEASVSSGTERLNREWTVWFLLAVMVLVLCETLLAWMCGRAW